jgi:hypothetical protein
MVRGCDNRDRPSRDLFTLGLLDDVRTLGLPMYHPREIETQLVAVPESMACSMDGKKKWNHHRCYVPPRPHPGYWLPEEKALLVSLTGPTEAIEPASIMRILLTLRSLLQYPHHSYSSSRSSRWQSPM